jgi:ABC-type branched-subunit amino acid transport system substrate-binding protein
VVGSTVTADDYDNIPGFIRVSPSNRQAGAVAVEYAAQEFTRVDLVEDENTTDSYDASLVTAFKGFSAPGRTIVGQEAYDTTARTEAKNPGELALAQSVIKNRIGQMPTNVCAVQLPDQPAAVLFAGRGSDMAEFISDLKNRPCLDKHITVVSGSDGAEIPFTPEVKAGLDSGVTVYYSGLASPDEWQRDDDAAVSKGRQGFDEFKKAVDASFPGAPISDGNSMMAYDSVLATVSAIRLATTPASAAHAANHLPPAQAVAGEFSALHGPLAVLGASGPLAFLADYTNDSLASDPNRKAVPIMLLNGDGTSKFQKLEWPPWPLALPLPY